MPASPDDAAGVLPRVTVAWPAHRPLRCARRHEGQAARRPVPRQIHQRVDVETRLHEIAEHVESPFSRGPERDVRSIERQRLPKKLVPQLVALERTVPHGAEDAARTCAGEELFGAFTSGDPPVMDFVARGLG